MSDTNRSQLYFIKEVTQGITPASALTKLRFAGESLGFNKSTITSDEIRDDRNIIDLITNGAEPVGGVDIEFSYGTYDEFLVASLQSAGWDTVAIAAATDISASSVDNSFNSTVTDFVAEGIQAGQWIKTAGFTGNPLDNNGYAMVLSVAINKIIVEGLTLVTETAGDPIDIDGSTITNGVAKSWFSLEKGFIDITQYIAFLGMTPNVFTLAVASKAKVTGTLSFVGMESPVASGITIGTGTALDATTTRIMSTVANIKAIREAGALLPASGQVDYVKNIALNINNNMVGKDGIGVLGNVDIRAGEANITGNLTAYFENADIYNKYVQDTESYISYRLEDPDNVLNSYIISLPRIRYGSGTPMIGGKNDDVMINANFQALMHGIYGYAVRIDKFAA